MWWVCRMILVTPNLSILASSASVLGVAFSVIRIRMVITFLVVTEEFIWILDDRPRGVVLDSFRERRSERKVINLFKTKLRAIFF
jgi:hypothetical protein